MNLVTPQKVLQGVAEKAFYNSFRAGEEIRPGTEDLAAHGVQLEPGGMVCGDALAAQITREITANTRIAQELNLKAE